MAAEVLVFRENWAGVAAYGLSSTRHSIKAIAWDEYLGAQRHDSTLRANLEYIALAWVEICARRKVGSIPRPITGHSCPGMISLVFFFVLNRWGVCGLHAVIPDDCAC